MTTEEESLKILKNTSKTEVEEKQYLSEGELQKIKIMLSNTLGEHLNNISKDLEVKISKNVKEKVINLFTKKALAGFIITIVFLLGIFKTFLDLHHEKSELKSQIVDLKGDLNLCKISQELNNFKNE